MVNLSKLTFVSHLSPFFIENILEKPGHNIFKLYDVLVQIQFTTSTMSLDILYKKRIQVASQIATQLKSLEL